MEAYIYDAVRTPRGRGKSDGSLHEIQPVDLLATVLKAIKNRNDLDTSYIDDVIMVVFRQLVSKVQILLARLFWRLVMLKAWQVCKLIVFARRVWRPSIWRPLM